MPSAKPDTAKNGSAKNIPPSKTPPSAPKPSTPVQNSVSSLIKTAGLPADKLSASILQFARFFSLPLKPDVMTAIRHQAFSPEMGQENTGKSADTVKTREAFFLAAAAAESKGVELQQKAFEAYAEAVDPGLRDRQNNDGKNRGRRNKNQHENTDGKTSVVTASGLEKTVMEQAENAPLLFVLNRLPGKNGQRWIVIPFDFCETGIEYSVSMRILLEAGNAGHMSNRSCLMALDIVESDKNRQLFVMESAYGKPVRLSVYLQSDVPAKTQASIKSELSGILRLSPECVTVKTSPDSFLCADSDGLFPSINEVV